nr:ATP-dependent DNA ligase [Microbacterium sp. G2-8]
MGRFRYNHDVETEFEDRTLAHLQVVIGSKLRRGESFFFTWKAAPGTGKGRTTIWMHPGCSLVFAYHGSRNPRLNIAWIDALAHVANSSTGLYVVREPEGRAEDSGVDREPSLP